MAIADNAEWQQSIDERRKRVCRWHRDNPTDVPYGIHILIGQLLDDVVELLREVRRLKDAKD